MFLKSWRPDSEYKEEPKAKPTPRFSPKIEAAIKGKPLPEVSHDRVFDDELPTGNPPPKIKKKKIMKEAVADIPVSEAGKAPDGIQSTKHYHRFRLLPTNRPVDQRHVNKLAAEIRRKNLLHLNPIIVNTAMEVIDGQHRLAAAEKLGVQIFFAQDAAISQDDIAGMNSNKKNWELRDYIHFFAEQGREDYIAFTAFCKEHPGVMSATLLGMCSKDGNVKRSYKDGQIDISGMEQARVTLAFLPDYDAHTPHARTTHFIKALSFIVRTGLYDHEHMKAKLEQNPGCLQPSPSERGYIESLERIYNRKMREENIVIFLKRR